MTTHETGQDLLDGRESVYGERVKNMQDVAQVWSGILGTEVRPDQVPLLMAGYKLVRASGTPDYSDNIDDVEGYALMFREVIGDKMVNAKSVKEYLEIKQPKPEPTFDEVLRGAQESMEERIERQQEEKAYGRSMGREDGKSPARTYHGRSNEYETAQLAKRLEEAFDNANSFVYGHKIAASHASEIAMRYFLPHLNELRQENALLESEIERKS